MGIFKAELPVGPAEREWADLSLAELTELFGPAQAWPTIVPTAQYFPEKFDGTQDDARCLLERACGWLQIDPAELDLEVFSDPADDEDEQRAALPFVTKWVSGDYVPGESGRGTVGLLKSNLHDALGLVATIGHELCHHLLISHKQVDPRRPDNEAFTDLLTVHLGLGIFSANARRRHHSAYGGAWSSTTLGYLTEQMFGYALARRCISLNDPEPTWQHYLAPNPRGFMKASKKALAPPMDARQASERPSAR